MGNLRDKGIEVLASGLIKYKLIDPGRICDERGAREYVENHLRQPVNTDRESERSYTGVIGSLKVITLDLSHPRLAEHYNSLKLQQRTGMHSGSEVEVVFEKDQVNGIGCILYGWIPKGLEDMPITEN